MTVKHTRPFARSLVAALAGLCLPLAAGGAAHALEVRESDPKSTIAVETSAAAASAEANATASAAIDTTATTATTATTTPPHLAQASQATIEYLEITTDGNRLLVRTDRRVDRYEAYWDRSSLAYAITIPNARFGPNVTLPDARDSDAIRWVNAESDRNGNVTIYVMPAPQVSVRGVNEPSTQMLALELQPYAASVGESPVRPSTFDWSSLDNLPTIRDGEIVVVLDPGHGGRDPGAVGIGGLDELDIVDPVTDRVAELLEENGVVPLLTRTGNYELDLEPRVDFANRVNANLFVSIHANAISMSRPDVNGIETYYFQTGDRFAEVVHASLLAATGSGDRGVRTARFYVLRNTAMPAILVEVGFVTGAIDAPRLRDPDHQELLARGIARGILEYVDRYCPGPYCEP